MWCMQSIHYISGIKAEIFVEKECIESKAHRPLQDRNQNIYNVILEGPYP